MGAVQAITDNDIVLYAAPTPEAIHAAVKQLYQCAKTKSAANGPTWTDADGEIHDRRYRLVFGESEDDRSLRQNRFYWGVVLKQISAQAPGGWTIDAWHEAFKRQVLGYEIVKVNVAGRKRPTVYRRLRSTTGLTVRQMSAYLDEVIATSATDLGVVFVFDADEREAVRWKRKPRTKKEPQ